MLEHVSLAVKGMELHVFCDASMSGYGVASHVRIIYADGNIEFKFCMGKSRLAPLTLSVSGAQFLLKIFEKLAKPYLASS